MECWIDERLLDLLPAGIIVRDSHHRKSPANLAVLIPAGIYLRRPSVFIVNFEHISHLVLLFVLLTLNM